MPHIFVWHPGKKPTGAVTGSSFRMLGNKKEQQDNLQTCLLLFLYIMNKRGERIEENSMNLLGISKISYIQ